jgi:high-affinity iron transporter
MTLGVAVATFALQRKLPYKRLLVVTGAMIAFVLVVMVGQTVRTLQGTGWAPITALGFDPPTWASLWLDVYPTWETAGAQLAAVVFVLGSYLLAQELRVKRPRRRAYRAARAASASAAATVSAPTASATGPYVTAPPQTLRPARKPASEESAAAAPSDASFTT